MTTILDEALRALRECADDLSAELAARYPPGARIYPSEEARFNRDMASVIKAREVLARADAQKDEAQGVTDAIMEEAREKRVFVNEACPYERKERLRAALEAVSPMLARVT